MTNFPGKLLGGYRDFMAGRFTHEKARYESLADKGQKPETMMITCCDSRAAPETVFNAGPGEIFIVRNVANLVQPRNSGAICHATASALEYAIQVLEVKNIIVMGHARCGGIAAALDPAFEPLSQDNFVGKWIGDLAPEAEAVRGNAQMTGDERQTAMERLSVRNSIENLRTYPQVSTAERKGKVQLHGAWFDISSGELLVLGEEGEFKRPPED